MPSVDRTRLVEVEMEGHEPFRLREMPVYERVLQESKDRLQIVAKYADRVFMKIDELRPYAISPLQEMVRTRASTLHRKRRN